MEVGLAIPPAPADKRPPVLRGRVFPDLGVQVTGILAAAVVRAGRAAAIRLTVDPACWFRFWVAIFTGAVAVVAVVTVPPAEMAVSAEEAAGPLTPRLAVLASTTAKAAVAVQSIVWPRLPEVTPVRTRVVAGVAAPTGRTAPAVMVDRASS